MCRRKLRLILVVAALGALAAAVVRALRGEPAPQFSTHPSVLGGPDLAVRLAPAAQLDAAPAAEPTPELEPEPAPAAAEEPTATTWMEPIDGACPDGYPIKAKLKSGIYHQPGGLAYDRTKPDRCYPTAEAAAADGLRPPKR